MDGGIQMNKLGGGFDDDQRSDADCPDFEVLSRFADDEITDSQARDLEGHLKGCARCAGLAAHLQAGFGLDVDQHDRGAARSGCGSEESLILYSMDSLPSYERLTLDAHLRICDACVASLTLVRRRMAVSESVAVPVPREVRDRARRAMELAMQGERGAPRLFDTNERWTARVARTIGEFLRPPVLVPAGLALGALIMVGIQESGMLAPQRGAELSRAVNREQQLRVSATTADVRSAPDARSDVVATVSRGTLLRVDVEQGHWYRVLLPGDKEGWVEGTAFE
jgi:anti-sigma factor RsiW